MTYKVAIIGLGNIGMLYDHELPAQDFVLSHARAFYLHPDFELVGAVDTDLTHRNYFSKTYNAATFSSVRQLFVHAAPEIFVVSSPTSTHQVLIEQILASCKAKGVLCEKPLANDSAEAQKMVDACITNQLPLYVNFIRRADPGVLEVKSRLESGQIVMPFKAIVWYSKGLLHNGSHFADLLTFWFGPIIATKLINPGRTLSMHDAEPDVELTFRQGKAMFIAASEENFSHCTVEVVAANGRLRYEHGGAIFWQSIAPHQTLKGYRQLDPLPEIIGNGMNHYQYHVVEQLHMALGGAQHTLCSGAWAAKTQASLENCINNQYEIDTHHE